ncbi:MAG: EamA family transporter [Rhodobacteraceae bacterium]|nr:EamA family transporter [Paracoccaceae bacterium]
MRLTMRELLMALAVPLIWGMGFVFAKAAIGHFPPILLMALRFTLTALATVWFAPLPRTHFWPLFWIAIVAAAIQYSLTFSGLKHLDAGMAALIVQLEVPFLVLLGALILKERPTMRKWLGIAVAFAGVALIAGQVEFRGEWVAVFMVIAGAFTWALGQVFIRRLKDITGATVTAWIAVFAALQLFVMSAIFETGQKEAILAAGWVVWGAVAYLGLVMTALGYFLWNTLIRAHDVGRVAPFLLLLPVCSVAGGAVFLGEVLTPGRLVGGAVVIAGVALITLERRRAPVVTPKT